MPKEKKLGEIFIPQYIKDKYHKDHRTSETFKAEVSDIPVRFPKSLGTQHPFNFKTAEDLYKTFGYVTGFIDKHVDAIVGNFSAKAKSSNVQAIIDSFIIDTNFQVALREWIKSSLITGNGFMELDLEESKVRVLDPKEMYVKRDKKGEVKKYNQYKGKLNRINAEILKEVNDFEPNKIAHLKINAFPLEAYGLGLIKPNLRAINNFLGNETDSHAVVSRKAGAPYHIKVGVPGEQTNKSVVEGIASNMEYMNTQTEWTTDANVDIKYLDFGDLGKGFDTVLQHDKLQLIAGFQVPEVLMGSGQLNEGIAKVQLSTFRNERIKSLQEDIEKVIEEKIFKPLLLRQGSKEFQEHVEFEWNIQSEESINERINKLTALLSGSIQTGENLKRMTEIEIAKALNIENYEQFLREPEVGLDDKKEEEEKAEKQAFDTKTKAIDKNEGKNSPEAKKEAKIKQPEVPGAKPSANQMSGSGCGQQITEKQSSEMTINEWVEDPRLKELSGFTYSDYILNILKVLKLDEFSNLLAITESDIELGLLSTNDVEKLREIFKSGFKKNLTINQIEKRIKDNVDLKDRLRINENGEKVLSVASQNRPNMIARTEASRLANQGLVEHYRDNKIEKVQFLASLSERTCPICVDLDGSVYTLNDSAGVIPVHANCRCTWIPVVK